MKLMPQPCLLSKHHPRCPLQEYARTNDQLTHFLTYADNNAVGYFAKQGFTKEITMPREQVCALTVVFEKTIAALTVHWNRFATLGVSRPVPDWRHVPDPNSLFTEWVGCQTDKRCRQSGAASSRACRDLPSALTASEPKASWDQLLPPCSGLAGSRTTTAAP